MRIPVVVVVVVMVVVVLMAIVIVTSLCLLWILFLSYRIDVFRYQRRLHRIPCVENIMSHTRHKKTHGCLESVAFERYSQ